MKLSVTSTVAIILATTIVSAQIVPIDLKHECRECNDTYNLCLKVTPHDSTTSISLTIDQNCYMDQKQCWNFCSRQTCRFKSVRQVLLQWLQSETYEKVVQEEVWLSWLLGTAWMLLPKVQTYLHNTVSPSWRNGPSNKRRDTWAAYLVLLGRDITLRSFTKKNLWTVWYSFAAIFVATLSSILMQKL